MPPERNSQRGFLLRATALFLALLVIWWTLLLPPLLECERAGANLLLRLLPGATSATGVTVWNGVWTVRVPVPVEGRRRQVRIELPRWVPVHFTLAFPLFWAVVAAAGSRRWCRILGVGTAALLVWPPFGLLIAASHVIQTYVYPNAPRGVAGLISGLDYVANLVAPSLGAVLLALALDRELRARVLGGVT